MADKLGLLLAFVLVGLSLSLAIPLYGRTYLFADTPGRTRPRSAPLLAARVWPQVGVSLVAVLLLAKLHQVLPMPYLAGSVLLSMAAACMDRQAPWKTAVTVLVGLLIATVLPWWLRQDNWGLSISVPQAAILFVVTAASYWMLTRGGVAGAESAPRQRTATRLIYLGFALGVAMFVLSVGQGLVIGDITTWHHWGAYIGPAQMIAAGALPLHDIPLQYGLGPSLILAQSCRIDCWAGMYWLTGLSTIVLTCVFGAIALQFNRSRHPLSVAITLAIVAVSCLLWTTFPPSLKGPIATPSTGGMRFLPGALMLFWVLRQSKSGVSLTSASRWGHLLWLTCILWSPEAGIHATAIWVPYFVWTRTAAGGAKDFVGSTATLVAALLGGMGLMALFYRLFFGDWPLAMEYFTYLLHPPGAMPVNPNGTVWFAIAAMACWFIAFPLGRGNATDDAADASDRRASWLVALLGLANFTYFLGRSHDNNILNLMPCISLLLIATRAISGRGVVNTLSTTLLASVVGFTTLFGGANFAAARQEGRLFSFSTDALVASFHRDGPGKSADRTATPRDLAPGDAAVALNYLRTTYQEPVEVLDRFFLIDSEDKSAPWSALHGPANLALLPTEIRGTYIARIAKRFHSPGWLLYEAGFTDYVPQHLLELDRAYDRTEELDFGTYRAIRYAPK